MQGEIMMGNQFEDFVQEQERELFRTEKFEAIGKGNDYIFQTLAFIGQGSQQLSLATTILSELNDVPRELKEELKAIQSQLHEFKEKLRDR
jgi:hypothetical protein